MLKQLTEEDFAVLRGPLESGRQSPNSLASTLFLGIFLQAGIFYLTYYIAGKYTIYPNFESIQTVHLWITAALIAISVVFAIPAVFKKAEKFQYFLSIIVTQNLSILFYLAALFILGESDNAQAESLVNFTWITLFIGALLFIATFIRFYRLLKKGHYRKGSRSEEVRGKFETTSYIPIAIIGSMGLVFLIQYVMKMGSSDLFDLLMFVFLPLGIFYTLIFVLPEQLVMLYCKLRFNSFNFDERGYLQSENIHVMNKKVKQS
ncbi:ABC transporter ATPase [Ureibacillus composti]